MTLSEVSLPITDEWGKGHALVFSPQLAARLAELHSVHGSQKLMPDPRQCEDGRLLLRADILIEVTPGGLLHAMWEAADKAILLPAVEVIPWADAVALLPPDPELP